MKNNSILRQIPTECQIKKELKQAMFGEYVFCPHCGSRILKQYEKRYRCKVCRKPFTLTSISWLKGMKISLQTFYLLLWAWTHKAPVDQARKLCGLSEPTIRRWYEKFRNHLPEEKINNLRLSKVVQMDEAYRKGYSIIGAKQKARPGKKRKMALQIVSKASVDRRNALDFLIQSVRPNSQLCTDGASIYRGIDRWWPIEHRYELHKKFEFALTSEIEGLWGNLFTFIRRMYHHATKEKIGSVVKEFTARSMYPEWFSSPAGYINISFRRLIRPVRTEWRGRYQSVKKRKETFTLSCQQNLTVFPFKPSIKNLPLVPSC